MHKIWSISKIHLCQRLASIPKLRGLVTRRLYHYYFYWQSSPLKFAHILIIFAHSAVWCWQQSWWTMVDHFLKLLNCRNFRGTLVSCQMDGRTLVGQKTGVFFNLKNLLVHPQLFLRHTDALDTLVHLCLNYSDELEKMFWFLLQI